MDEKMLVIGARIREQRKKIKMTQKELGEAIDRTESLISAYEKGKVDIPHNMIVKLAKELNVSPIYLQYGQTPEERAGALFGGVVEEELAARVASDTLSLDGLTVDQRKALRALVDSIRNEE